MTTTPRTAGATSRERLLDAAAELFYREGVGVGVEALCRTAGVSKRSMYQLFTTKDEVVAASLERTAPTYEALLLPAEAPEDDPRSPRERMLHVFERLEESAATAGYQGCPFVSTAVELKDPGHPASTVARRHKQRLTDFFQGEAERGGAHDPVLLAQQLTMLFDGAGARAVVRAEPLAGVAVTTAGVLLDAAGITAGR